VMNRCDIEGLTLVCDNPTGTERRYFIGDPCEIVRSVTGNYFLPVCSQAAYSAVRDTFFCSPLFFKRMNISVSPRFGPAIFPSIKYIRACIDGKVHECKVPVSSQRRNTQFLSNLLTVKMAGDFHVGPQSGYEIAVPANMDVSIVFFSFLP